MVKKNFLFIFIAWWIICNVFGFDQPVTSQTINGDSKLNAEKSITISTNELEAAYKSMVNSWPRGTESNGVFCAISFAPDSWAGSPAFYIHLFNNSTNYIYGYVRPPFESAEMELFDSNGNQVAKTAMGKTVGGWTDKKIEDWFDEFVRQQKKAIYRSHGLTGMLFPSTDIQISDMISLLKYFQIKKPGEYSLRLKTRFVLNQPDTAGKYHLKIFWLPEVTAKITVSNKALSL